MWNELLLKILQTSTTAAQYWYSQAREYDLFASIWTLYASFDHKQWNLQQYIKLEGVRETLYI